MLIIAGCGGGSSSETTTAVSTDGAGSTSTAAVEETTTTVAEETTTTTLQAPTTTQATEQPNPLPATFLAITSDFEAVEVDTATGEIVHVFGQEGTPEEVAAAEEMMPNVLVGVWRVSDGSMVGISDCCEPAAGSIAYLPADGELGSRLDNEWITGWTLSPSPTANVFANLGYTMIVADPSVTEDTGTGIAIDGPDLGFPGGAAAWARDGSELFWVTKKDGATGLATLDLAEGAPAYVADLPWVGEAGWIDGIGSQASGNLVGFVDTYDDSSNLVDTEGVVFTTTGELVANFPVELGATWGGYDPDGVYLIYVDGETVRWQGGGGSGVLAGNGFLFASW
jgi:hypothetical protein